MKKLLTTIFLLSLFQPQVFSYDKKAKKELLKIKLPKEVVQPLESTATYKSNLLNDITDAISFEMKGKTVLMLPLIYSSKNLGPHWGLMPIMALGDSREGTVKSVIAPSYDYNSHLGDTFSYRHYLFPDEKSIFIFRGAYSENIKRDFLLSYYTPNIFGENMRLNAEVWKSADPESFFYGYGPDSDDSDKANYALYSTGGSFSVTTRFYESLYLDFTGSHYTGRIEKGVVETPVEFKDRFPADYAQSRDRKDFFTGKFSFILDNTDHPFLPKVGNFLTFSMLVSREALGSDYSYTVYSFEGKRYFKPEGGKKEKYVTAVRYLLQWQTGEDQPFYAQSVAGESTGLRMESNGRYTGRGKFLFNIEERITVSRSPLLKFVSELEISPFLDVGTVFEEVSDLDAEDLKFGPGVSFRVLLRPQVVATAELAFGGSEGMNAIIKVGYPF